MYVDGVVCRSSKDLKGDFCVCCRSGASVHSPWKRVWTMEGQFDGALRRKARAAAVFTPVPVGRRVQVHPTPESSFLSQTGPCEKDSGGSCSHSPVQCYGETTYCWCVDQDGREVAGTRSHDAVKPACEWITRNINKFNSFFFWLFKRKKRIIWII